MQINDILTVNIEKMLFGGAGLARVNGFPIFVEDVCPQDILKVKITKINKKYATAEIVEIIEPSQMRVQPICSLHNVCGSCNWQHISYEEQLNQKENIVKETIKNITGFDYKIEKIIPSPVIMEYRCKVQYPVSQTKVSKRILSGYYKSNSHELINIKFCPMNKPIICEITEFLKQKIQELDLTGYNEKSHKGLFRHFVFRQSSDEKEILLILVINDNQISHKLKVLADAVIKNFPQIVGVCANFNAQKTNVILGKNTQIILGNDYYIENLLDKKYKVSANSFFQVNPYCASLIFNKVKELISNNINKPSILDAYAGVSSFGIWMSDIASKVVCIEESKSSTSDAVENVKLNLLSNVEIINGDAAVEFKKLIDNNIKFDVCLVDPPRKGCSEESIKNLVSLSKKYIAYVSCNVSTLARDMNLLANNGYYPVYIQPADMFPNTYHVETICLFKLKEKL